MRFEISVAVCQVSATDNCTGAPWEMKSPMAAATKVCRHLGDGSTEWRTSQNPNDLRWIRV